MTRTIPFLLGIALTVTLVSSAVAAPDLIPLNTLGTNKYQGFMGGLYADGRNEPSPAHAEALTRISSSIRPLDKSGKPDANGKIVVAGIGASVCRQIFAEMETMAAKPTTEGINPAVVVVNCALGGQDVNKIADSAGRYWKEAEKSLAARDVTAAQVQVVWYQSDDLKDPGAEFPGRPQRLKEKLAEQMRLIKQHFPNVRICYHSARHTTAFMPNDEGKSKHAEPRPYHVGWSVKWLIEDQMSGQAGLRFEGEGAVAPLVSWAGYFWTNGDKPRHDGYKWTSDDVVKDGVHLSDASRPRVAKELLAFFAMDTYAQSWFSKGPKKITVATPRPTPTPAPKSAIRKDVVTGEPAWIVNGSNKMPKLQRLLATTDGVRVIIRDRDGKQVKEIQDVFKQHTDLNNAVGAGEYRLEFYDKDGKRITLTQEVGEILRLK